MTTQYSPILKLALPVQGELSGTWGDVVNDNITSMVEQAIAGRAVINTWTTNSHTLTSANGTTSESRCAMLELTDTGTALSGAGTVVCPTASKIYIVKNAAGQNITVTTSGGTGILVPNGRTTFLFCDGTNVVEALTHTTSLQLGTSTTVTAVLDEDNMASDSATSLATQQSIKAYVDSKVGQFDSLSEVLAVGNTTGSNNIIVDNGQKITTNTIDETTAGSGVTIDSVLLKDDVVNATDVETGSISANDGTTAATIANSTGVVTVPSAVLTTADINGGTADGVVIGGTTPAAATVTTAVANTSLTIAGTTTVTSILDEDNMASDDPAGLATQQSIKAYVDSQVGTVDTLAEILANGNTTGGNDIVFSAGDNITNASGDLTIDVAGEINLDTDGAVVNFKDGGTTFGLVTQSSNDFVIRNPTSDKNLLFKGNDGGSTITALTLDMSEAGAATFNAGVTLSGDLTVDTNTLYVDSANDRVGINNIGSTGYDLYVGNGLTGTKAFALNGQGSSSSVMNIDLLGGGTGNPSGRIAFSSSTEALSFSTGDNASITTAMTIDSAQRVLIGTDTARSTAGHTANLQVEGSGSFSEATVSIVGNENNSNGAYLNFGKSRGTTAGSNTIVQDGDVSGQIQFTAADGTDMVSRVAAITAKVDGTPGANDTPGLLDFSTTADGAPDPTLRMRIDSQGFVGINQTTPQNNLDIKGTGGSTAAKLRVGGATGSEASGFRIDHTNSGSTTSVLENLYYSTSSAAVVTLRSSVLKFESGTSADEAMRIDSSGNVEIGGSGSIFTSSFNETVLAVTSASSNTNAAIEIRSNTGAADTYSGAIHFINEAAGASSHQKRIAQIQVDTSSDVDSGELVLLTNPDVTSGGPQEAMRIDSSQRTIIGGYSHVPIINASVQASVVGGSADSGSGGLGIARFGGPPIVGLASSPNTTVGSYTLTSNGTAMGYLYYGADDGTDLRSSGAYVAAVVDGAPAANDMPGRLVFATTISGAATPTERMRINNSGDVTIGNAADARARLEVYDSGVSAVYDAGDLSTWRVMQVRNNIESVSGTAAGIAFGGDGSGDTETAGIVGISDNSTGGIMQLAFITATGNNSLEAMRIDSSQRVIIGSGGSVPQKWWNSTSYGTLFGVENNNLTNANFYVTGGFIRNTADSEGPQIGLGKSRSTTTGGTTIVQSGDTIGLITAQGADGTNLVETTRIWSQIDGTPGANDMPGRLMFSTTSDGNQTPTERMRIDSSGRVGISYSNPSVANAYGNGLVVGNSSISGSAGLSVIADTDIGYSSIYFGDTSDNFAGGFEYNHNTDVLAIFSANAGQLRVGNNELTPTGSGKDLGSPTYQWRDLFLSGGIQFDSRSNKLDDYEEGTWTPADGTAAGLTIAINHASYTKIGRVVHVKAYILIPTTTSGTNIRISGLPYTNVDANGWAPTLLTTNGSPGSTRFIRARANEAVLDVGTAEGDVSSTWSQYSNKWMIFSLVYSTS